MPNGFWGDVGDGNQAPGQWGASPVTTIGNGGQVPGGFWSNYFANGAQAGARPGIGYDTTNADAARTWQTQMIQDLQQQAAGNPNSRAQQTLRQGYTDARAGQSALGSATRGTGGAAGLRQGMAGGANVQRGYAGDSAMLMQQEKTAAQALLAQQLAAQRQQDMAQAQGMATNALGNTSLDDAMRQFYTSGGINTDVAATQLAADKARAQLGLDLEGKDIQTELNNRLMNSAATATATASRFASAQPRTGSGYRQVDGQDSIVPDWDK